MEYNLNEIFDIAISIEKTGYTFYSEAAKALPEYSDFFTYLANEEIGHDHVFKSIKKDNVSKDQTDSVYDPDQLIPAYFESLSGSTIFKKELEIFKLFQGVNTIEEVIDWAINREHDTILFFIGLKSTLDNDEDKDVVEKIISEEIKHVHILMDKKSKL